MPAPRCDETVAWAALRGHFEGHGRELDLREAFAREAYRFQTFSLEAPEVFADLSKNRWDVATRRFLLELARQCRLEARRDAMLRGDRVNVTEGRAVLHTALRAPRGTAPHADEVHATLEAMLAFAEAVRADGDVRDVVHIGIGGSDLGPRMAVQALRTDRSAGPRLHFVANVDAHEIAAALAGLDARHTLLVVASKTFTTQETMANAQVARRWLGEGGADLARRVVALTANRAAAQAFGAGTVFELWDWVGGRFSMWGAIGLPIAIAIGAGGFRELLAGAHAMDQHFATQPLEANLPVQLGLLDVWYRNFHGYGSRCVAPYHQGLARLPAYLQQLEMESNGKSVDLEGRPLPFDSSPVVWGEPGTNAQHAFFQMLHQGTQVVPVEFIVVREATHTHADMQAKTLAHALAQAQALMRGKTTEQACAELAAAGASPLDCDALAPHKTFPGNRPSTVLLLPRLTPRSLGALIAMYEHRVFVSGALWNIDSFDQWGVELGKTLAGDLLPRLASGDVASLDASTAGLIRKLRGG